MMSVCNRRTIINTALSSASLIRRMSLINVTSNQRTINGNSNHPHTRRPLWNILRRTLALHVWHQHYFIRSRSQQILRSDSNSERPLSLSSQRPAAAITSKHIMTHLDDSSRLINVNSLYNISSLLINNNHRTRNSVIPGHIVRRCHLLISVTCRLTRQISQRILRVSTVGRSLPLRDIMMT